MNGQLTTVWLSWQVQINDTVVPVGLCRLEEATLFISSLTFL